MDNLHRDALGNLTVPPQGAKVARCGHALPLDFNHDERCPYCLDYEAAYQLDRAAALLAIEQIRAYGNARPAQ